MSPAESGRQDRENHVAVEIYPLVLLLRRPTAVAAWCTLQHCCSIHVEVPALECPLQKRARFCSGHSSASSNPEHTSVYARASLCIPRRPCEATLRPGCGQRWMCASARHDRGGAHRGAAALQDATPKEGSSTSEAQRRLVEACPASSRSRHCEWLSFGWHVCEKRAAGGDVR